MARITPAPQPSTGGAATSTSKKLGSSFAKGANVAKSGAIGAVTSVSNTATKLVLGGEDEKSWEELKAVEKRRRAILKRGELPFFRILTFYDGTVLHALARDPLMYITMLIYILVRIFAYVGLPDWVSDVGGADIGIIGAFLSFFLVFYVVACNKRFDALYGMSMSCEGRIFDAAALAKSSMPKENALRLIRYMNAVHITGYTGLSPTYNGRNFFEEINKSNKLLTPQECERMTEIDMDMGGSAYRELTTWCCAEIATAQKNGLVDSRLASQLRELVLRLRGSLGGLYDFDDQRVSFFYIHFVCLLSAMYLPLFAISSALSAGTGSEAYWVNDVVTGLIVFTQCTFVIGLRLLGQKMSNPYGDDVEDLSVMHYVNFTWRMSRRMLEAELPEPVESSFDFEKSFAKESQPLGEAWGSAASTVAEDDDDNEEDTIFDEAIGDYSRGCFIQ